MKETGKKQKRGNRKKRGKNRKKGSLTFKEMGLKFSLILETEKEGDITRGGKKEKRIGKTEKEDFF